MNKKRIRQMDLALRRRLSDRPAADYFAPGNALLRTIESEGYMQRFAGLFSGARLRCADVLALCRPELETLCPGEPSEGWLAYAYDYARRLLYPEKTDAEPFAPGAVFLLSVLQVLFAAEAELLPHDPAWTFDFLTDDELAGSPCAPSYQRFLRLWRREFVYELMRLGLEVTPYRTLEHIAGVHHLAVTAARALRKSGVAVDVALVSGAAAGHDLGKFGCRPGERVPYLHYFYTDQWFRRRRMTDIGHVAANHSVWDLEPDYLSVEALLLIYADFRVKQLHDAQGREITRISTLAEAFQVILDKLDDVDGEKQKRYTRVYARLEDFEQFMVSCGVDVTMSGGDTPPLPEKHTALMTDDEALRALTLRCVGHNMELMHRLTDQRSFARLLEEARGETDWRRLRAYLAVMESYSLYLHIPQKVQTLTFLYELLMHREGDIRRQAAALLGEIIAGFHAGYAKERPADIRPDPRAITDVDQWRLYLDKILYPDHKLMPQHRRWIGYTLKFAVGSLLSHCPGREERFLAPVFAYYRRPEDLDDYTAFQLLDTAAALPDTAYTASRARQMTDFAAALSLRKDLTIRMAAVLLLDRLARLYPEDGRALEAVTAVPDGDSGTLRYLKQDVLSQGAPLLLPEDVVSEIFLDNLKTATPWITKQGNLRLLTDFARSGKSPALHIATHLSNLIKVSDRVTVRHSAGNALLALAPRLTADQRNEVAVELCRGLELGQQEFTKYIPDYLGRFALWLPPAELDEVLDDLRVNLSSSDSRVTASVLDTVGVIYEAYDAYRSRFPETDDAYRRRRERLLGLLMRGLSGIDGATRQEALFVLGRRVFGSGELGRHEKRRAFMLTQRKLLSAQDEFPGEGLTFYYRAAMLGKLYRFITEERLFHKGFDFGAPRPVAFFPGTFDPFTLSHKGIVRAIRDQGFEVLLAIDEFSWSKKTQPYRLRRRIAAMAVADVFHVSIFPEDFPVNIANPENLHELRAAFPGRLGKALYDVAGAVLLFDLLRAQHHADERAAAADSGGDKALAGGIGAAGLNALGAGVQVPGQPPVGDQGVGAVEHALLLGLVGGRYLVGLGVHHGHKVLVLHGLAGDEIQIVGGGVVAGLGQAGGVGKVGVFAPQLLGALVHALHKGIYAAAQRFAQDVARLVGGDDQHTVQQLLHRQRFTFHDVGGAAVLRQAAQGGGGGGDLLVQPQLTPVDGLEDQQGGHDLGGAGNGQLIVDIFVIEYRAGLGLHQQRGLGTDGRILQRGGGNGQNSA